MNQFIKNLISELKLLSSFNSREKQLVLIHTSERFDVVLRVPAYTRITFPNGPFHF